MNKLIATIILTLLLPLSASGDECPMRLAQEAEEKAAYLSTWDQVFRAWQLYNQCDDGSISEGFSESITLILSSNWTEKGHLIKLIEKQPDFGEFVIGHIDQTVPFDRLSKIGHMAKMRCIDSTNDFCMAVLRKVNEE